MNGHETTGMPSMLYTRHVCAVLDVPPSRVKHWFDVGLLPARRLAAGRQRYVTAADLILFCAETDLGITPDWEAVLDVD